MQNEDSKKIVKSRKRALLISFLTVTAIVVFAFVYFLNSFFYDPIATRDWQLSYVFVQEPFAHVSHCEPSLLSDSNEGPYAVAKPIEVVCYAENGVLTFTDVTAGEIYEGTYTKLRHTSGHSGERETKYKILFGDTEGKLNISTDRKTATVVIDEKWIMLSVIENKK